ncbi:hypothetical protein QF032_005601 [Streptomyces achromogenes]|nr:hypothetical protein [Streptomyces achromogenes]
MGRRATAKPVSRGPERSAVPRTATTAPVAASRTGPPAAPPPSRSASRPAVPIASSMAPPSRWRRSVAVYVTGVWARTRASRQQPAISRTYRPGSTPSRTVTGNGSAPRPSVRTSARSSSGSGVTASALTTQLRSPAAWTTSRERPSTASWLVSTVPWWSATKPAPRGRPARSRMRTREASAPRGTPGSSSRVPPGSVRPSRDVLLRESCRGVRGPRPAIAVPPTAPACPPVDGRRERSAGRIAERKRPPALPRFTPSACPDG